MSTAYSLSPFTPVTTRVHFHRLRPKSGRSRGSDRGRWQGRLARMPHVRPRRSRLTRTGGTDGVGRRRAARGAGHGCSHRCRHGIRAAISTSRGRCGSRAEASEIQRTTTLAHRAVDCSTESAGVGTVTS